MYAVSLIPFATFSLFHCATFIRANVIPKFAPQPAAPQAAGQGQRTLTAPEQVGRAIQLWVKGQYTLHRSRACAQTSRLSRRLNVCLVLGVSHPGNYDRAMKFVAYAELVIFLRVLVGAAL